MKKQFILLLAVLLAALLPACSNASFPAPNGADTAIPGAAETAVVTDPVASDVPAAPDEAVYYCPVTYGDSPAKVINILTGEVLVACPDPLCSHGLSSETCFFNYSYDRTLVFASVYVDHHIFFAAQKTTEDGDEMKLYDYSFSNNRIDEVYTYDYIASSVQLYTNGRLLFFTSIEGGDSAGEAAENVSLYSFDPVSRVITLLDDRAAYALHPSDVAFFNDYYIYSDHYDSDADRLWFCRRSYDGTVKECFDALPDGTPFMIFGYQLRPSGYFINTWGEGGIRLSEEIFVPFQGRCGVWLDDENRILQFPVEGAVTSPAVYNGSFYFQTRSTEAVDIGRNYADKRKIKDYLYDNEVYVLDKDGSCRHYSLDTDYHFIIKAAYENIVIGQIEYQLLGGGMCVSGTEYGPDLIRIDLSTGEATLYDTSKRNHFVLDNIIIDIRLIEE